METSTDSGSRGSITSRGPSPSSSSGPSGAFWSSPWTVTAVIACAILCCSLLALLVACISRRWRHHWNRSGKASTGRWGCWRRSAADRSSGGSNQNGNSSLTVGGMSLASIRQQLAVRRLSGGHNGYGCLKEEAAADSDDCLPTANAGRASSATSVMVNAEPVAAAPAWQQNKERHDFAWPVGSTGAYKPLPSEPPKIAPPAVAVQTSHMKPTVVAAIAMHRHRESSLFNGGSGGAGVSTRQPYERLSEESRSPGNRSPGSGGEPEIVFSRRTAL